MRLEKSNITAYSASTGNSSFSRPANILNILKKNKENQKNEKIKKIYTFFGILSATIILSTYFII